MKKILTVVLAAAIAIFLFLGIGGKTDEEMIADRINAFARAYNSGDMEEAIGCMDAKSRNAYMAALQVGDAIIGLTGFDIGMTDLFSLGIAIAEEGEAIQFTNLDIEMNSDSDASVRALMYLEGYGTEYGKKIAFHMVKENGDWYLDGGV